MKEPFATILKCMEDKQSLDFSNIHDAMNNWTITQNGKKLTKSDKFSESETMEAVNVIIHENWEKNVLAR